MTHNKTLSLRGAEGDVAISACTPNQDAAAVMRDARVAPNTFSIKEIVLNMQPIEETPYQPDPETVSDADMSAADVASEALAAGADPAMDPDHSGDVPADDPGNPGDIHQLLQEMEARLINQRSELDHYRRLFHDMRSDAEQKLRQADEEAFLNEVRASYEKDPIAAFRMMLDKTQFEMWHAIQDQLQNELKRDAQQRKMLNDLLGDPANSLLKPYTDEIEYLVSDRGFEPEEAARFLRTVAQKAGANQRNKAHAVERMRHRSSVESGGGPSRPTDPDREFYRIIKKAKTLDDMFEGLRKAGRRAAP